MPAPRREGVMGRSSNGREVTSQVADGEVHLVTDLLMGLLYQPRVMDEYGAIGGMIIGRGNRSTREETCPSATSSTTNLT
jgi:hypothetical protein